MSLSLSLIQPCLLSVFFCLLPLLPLLSLPMCVVLTGGCDSVRGAASELRPGHGARGEVAGAEAGASVAYF